MSDHEIQKNLKETGDTSRALDDAQLKTLREKDARLPGGRFKKGNRAALGRKTQRREKTAVFRDIVAATPKEKFAKIWARLLLLATGDDAKKVNPEPWAVKLVIENLIGNRLVIEQAEEIEELRLIVEQWLSENHPTSKDNGEALRPETTAERALETFNSRSIIDAERQANKKANDADGAGVGD